MGVSKHEIVMYMTVTDWDLFFVVHSADRAK